MEAKQRLVAMADVLGFKKAIEENGTLELAIRYKELLSRIKRNIHGSNGIAHELTLFGNRGTHEARTDEEPEIEYEIFSDTVVLWTRPIDLGVQAQADFPLPVFFLDCIREMLLEGFTDGLPLRVGIGYGDSIMERSERIYIGRALIDAHETEQTQDWIGAAFHRNCIDALKRWQDCFHNLRFQGLLVAYVIPCKPTNNAKCPSYGKLEWSMDWLLEWRRKFESADHVKQHFDVQKSKATGGAKKKWERTLKFFQTCEKLDYNNRQIVRR